MNGVPATISNNGRVFAAGTFTFYVTCEFEFSNFPYDEQVKYLIIINNLTAFFKQCPIVIADWMYDLSKVNLSESVSNSNMKPSIRLSFDPLSETSKKHIAG